MNVLLTWLCLGLFFVRVTFRLGLPLPFLRSFSLSVAETNLGLDEEDEEKDLERDRELDGEPDLERMLPDFLDSGLELRLLSDILVTPSALTGKIIREW